MTDLQFYRCVQGVDAYTDRDAYISDLALSSLWGDSEDADVPAERITALGEIFDACHRTIKEIASEAGISNRKLAERFCIPYRTIENWSAGHAECALYIRLMIQECLDLLPRK